MAGKFLDKTGLDTFWYKLKNYFQTKLSKTNDKYDIDISGNADTASKLKVVNMDGGKSAQSVSGWLELFTHTVTKTWSDKSFVALIIPRARELAVLQWRYNNVNSTEPDISRIFMNTFSYGTLPEVRATVEKTNGQTVLHIWIKKVANENVSVTIPYVESYKYGEFSMTNIYAADAPEDSSVVDTIRYAQMYEDDAGNRYFDGIVSKAKDLHFPSNNENSNYVKTITDDNGVCSVESLNTTGSDKWYRSVLSALGLTFSKSSSDLAWNFSLYGIKQYRNGVFVNKSDEWDAASTAITNKSEQWDTAANSVSKMVRITRNGTIEATGQFCATFQDGDPEIYRCAIGTFDNDTRYMMRLALPMLISSSVDKVLMHEGSLNLARWVDFTDKFIPYGATINGKLVRNNPQISASDIGAVTNDTFNTRMTALEKKENEFEYDLVSYLGSHLLSLNGDDHRFFHSSKMPDDTYHSSVMRIVINEGYSNGTIRIPFYNRSTVGEVYVKYSNSKFSDITISFVKYRILDGSNIDLDIYLRFNGRENGNKNYLLIFKSSQLNDRVTVDSLNVYFQGNNENPRQSIKVYEDTSYYGTTPPSSSPSLECKKATKIS